jgi:hypothetical protein
MKHLTLALATAALIALPAASMAQQGPTKDQQEHITGKDRGGKLTPTHAADEKGAASMAQQGPSKDQQEHITGKDRGGQVTGHDSAAVQKESMDKDKMGQNASGDMSKEKGTTTGMGEDKNRGRNSPAAPVKE